MVLRAFSEFFKKNQEKYSLLEKWLYETKNLHNLLESKRNVSKFHKKAAFLSINSFKYSGKSKRFMPTVFIQVSLS